MYDRQTHRDLYCYGGRFAASRPVQRPSLDLLDTSGCSRSGDCVACGSGDSYSITSPVPSLALVACLRTCTSCGADAVDQLDAGRIDDAVADHCDHLGVTRPRMRGAYLSTLQLRKGA